MDTEWISKRPYLAPVVARMNELLEHAAALIERTRGSGESVDYGAFEEEVAARTAQVEAAIHEAALSSLDLNAPFVRVWGKTYRRVHRAPRTYGTLAVTVRSAPSAPPGRPRMRTRISEKGKYVYVPEVVHAGYPPVRPALHPRGIVNEVAKPRIARRHGLRCSGRSRRRCDVSYAL